MENPNNGSGNSIDNGNGGDRWPRKPMPQTTDGKLEEVIRRLGRIEKHLIDLKGNPPPPGALRYQPEVDKF